MNREGRIISAVAFTPNITLSPCTIWIVGEHVRMGGGEGTERVAHGCERRNFSFFETKLTAFLVCNMVVWVRLCSVGGLGWGALTGVGGKS